MVIAKSILALVFVIALIALTAIAFQKLAIEKRFSKTAKAKRLKLVDSLYIDAKRKLILVTKDEDEVLLLIGANSETVITDGSISKSPATPRKKKKA